MCDYPNAFVLAWLTLVLVLDADNVFLEIERAEGEPRDTDKNEKYVCHAPKYNKNKCDVYAGK